jgi:anti-sigma factor RsiW
MTSDSASRREDLRCMEFVTTVSAYIDGEVTQEQRRRIDDHLEGCQGCRAALGQFRTAIRSTGRLKPEDVARIDPLIRDRLIAMLRIPRRR